MVGQSLADQDPPVEKPAAGDARNGIEHNAKGNGEVGAEDEPTAPPDGDDVAEDEPGHSRALPGARPPNESEAARPEAIIIVAPHDQLDPGTGRNQESSPVNRDPGKAEGERKGPKVEDLAHQ